MTGCPRCDAEMPDGTRFCRECGASMVVVRSCQSCGAVDEGGKFCGRCGTLLVADRSSVGDEVPGPDRPVAERRVTSVLFADLVGFTPLAEARDAEEVRELLSRYFAECRTVIGRYGGTVEKFIGDAVMAVWGVPISHEDDAERAVRAGLELVHTVSAMGEDLADPDLAVRVGVVTGEVAVTVGATDEGMVAGDAVNTASRVQSVADIGSVWVDEATRSLTAASIAYADAGEHLLKGKAGPMRLWVARAVVADVGGGQRVDGLEAPLAGRDRELRMIKELFHSTQESARPRLVVVDGEPGVGKSRLAWEFEKYVDGLAATVRWHRGRCLSYGDGVAFWALAEALRPRLGLTEADSTAAVTASLEASLEAFVPVPEEREWLRPRLAALVGASQGAGFAREDLFSAWTVFLERLSEGGNAVVLVIDDAQFADEGLLDFLDSMLAAARAPIFVLVLARPELLTRRPELGGRRASVVRLDALDDAVMATLVDGLVLGLPTNVRADLVVRAEGVPLFAIETIRALIDRDAVVPRDGHYVPADGVELDLASIGAPASLQALVAARLDALSSSERAVVADASVLGASFTRAGLAAVSSAPAGIDDALSALQRKEIIAVQLDRFSAERGQFRFVQAVVRQVAYGTLSRRDRKQRHLAAADFLATQPDPGDDLAVVIAQHLLDAVDAASSTDTDAGDLVPRACALLERAGSRAKTLGSPAEARRLFEAALTRSHEREDRARLHLACGEAAHDAGDYEAGAAHARTAVELYDELERPIDAGVAAGVVAFSLQILSDFAGVVAIAEPRWQVLEGIRDSERALLRIAGPLANAHLELKDVAAAAHYVERRVLLAEAVGDPDDLAKAMINMGGRYQGTGGPRVSRALYEGAADVARTHDLPGALAHALINLSTILMSRDLPAATDALFEARDMARRAGVSGMVDYAAGNCAAVLWSAGRLTESQQLVQETMQTATAPTIQMGLVVLEAYLADAQGAPLPALPDIETALSSADLAARGSLDAMRLLAEGDVQGAAALSEATLAHLLGAAGLEDDFMHYWPPLVRAALAAGDVPLAERMLEPVDGSAPGLVSVAVAAHLRNLRGLVGAARGDEPLTVEADLRAGVAALADFGAVGWSARAEEDLGRWLATQGRADDSALHLEHARTTYAQIGATGWLKRLDALV